MKAERLTTQNKLSMEEVLEIPKAGQLFSWPAFFVMWKNGHITGKTGVNWYRVSKWRVRQRTGSGKMPDVFRRNFFL